MFRAGAAGECERRRPDSSTTSPERGPGHVESIRQPFQALLGSEVGPLLMLAVVLVMGAAGGWMAKRIRIPGVTGNIIAGAVIGPAFLNVFGGAEAAKLLQPLSSFAMGLIAVAVGGQFSYRRIHNALRRILTITVFEALLAVGLVSGVLLAVGTPWPVALLLGSLASETAPATTVAVVREMRARGPFVKTLLSVVSLDASICIMMFAFTMTLVGDYYRTGASRFSLDTALLNTGWVFLGALVLGLAAGIATEWLVRRTRVHHFSIVVVAILLCVGLSAHWHLSPLLTSLVFGAYLGNASREAETQLRALEPLEPLLYIAFFTLAGIGLHLDMLAQAGLLTVLYLGARFLGKSVGAAAGGLLSRTSRRIWSNIPFAVLPQAGVVLGLVVLLEGNQSIPADVSHVVGTVVLAAVTVNEILGPLFTRFALGRAREVGLDRPRLMEFLQEEFILTDLRADDKWDALRKLTDFYARTHNVRAPDREAIYETVVEREKDQSTAVGMGAAIPHGRVENGTRISGALGIAPDGIDFGAPDGEPVKLIMFIVTPREHEALHLEVLRSLAEMISNERVRTRLISAIDANDAWEVIESEETRGLNYFLEDETSDQPNEA